MTNKELQEWLLKYPDNAIVTSTWLEFIGYDSNGDAIIDARYPLIEEELHYFADLNVIQITFSDDREDENYE